LHLDNAHVVNFIIESCVPSAMISIVVKIVLSAPSAFGTHSQGIIPPLDNVFDFIIIVVLKLRTA
jgi:hypothetical protein